MAARFAFLDGLDVDGVKAFLESGFGPRRVWPIHPPAVRDAIVRAAGWRNLPMYVHANREEDKAVALDMGAHGILHAGYYEAAPTDAFVRRMAAAGAYLVTTFSIMDGEVTRFHPERLEDRVVRRAVPSLELGTARDPAAGRLLARTEVGMTASWIPFPLRGIAARFIITEAANAARLRSSQRAVKRFFDAGVPIVVGTDSGNWPVVPNQLHGPSTLRQIELLGEAGLSPADAIASATRVSAEMLGLGDEIGTVAPGKRADLLIVRRDPLRSLRALRTIRWTVRDGVAHTPAEWLAE